jgi:hypothetical protein
VNKKLVERGNIPQSYWRRTLRYGILQKLALLRGLGARKIYPAQMGAGP